jgi:thymidylate synthase (FAD)
MGKMKLIDQSWEWEQTPIPAATLIEKAGRTCYKSEDAITKESAIKFCRNIIKRGHLSVIEHASASIRLITNRGVTHELVRHRLASYSQESTRYCNYSKDKFGNELTFIRPVWGPNRLALLSDRNLEDYDGVFIPSLKRNEKDYFKLLECGWSPQQAREVLPNALKTEIVMTANLREWMHVFSLRCSNAAHPQIRALFLDVLKSFHEEFFPIFEKLHKKFIKE